MRVLYIDSSWVPPATDRRRDPFFLLSAELEGDVLKPVWCRTPAEIERRFGEGSYPVYTSGRFRYHWFLAYRYNGLRRKISAIWFYISKGIEIYRERNSECVIAYSHLVPGLCGAILKALTRMKLIVEIVTSPERSCVASKPKPTLGDRIKQFFSEVSLQICVQCSDRAQLRAPGLLSPYPKLQSTPVSVFAGFVVVSLVPRHRQADEQYILLVGSPWYLKGADTLIEAFKRLSGDFPDVRLKFLGFYPDSQQLEALTGGSPKIEILKARTNPEALEVISRATIFASPSRCEGSPRVVVEAMAAGVPVVGSDAGGIPYLVHNGENGFVVPVGDAVALERRLRQLLEDRDLRERMGMKGYELAHTEFGESAYVRHFTQMVQETVKFEGGSYKMTKERMSPFHLSKNP